MEVSRQDEASHEHGHERSMALCHRRPPVFINVKIPTVDAFTICPLPIIPKNSSFVSFFFFSGSRAHSVAQASLELETRRS